MRTWFTPWRLVGLSTGLAAFAFLLLWRGPLEPTAARAAAVTALMAILWVTEAIPIHATACIPLVLFPIVQVVEGGVVANLRVAVRPYFDPYVFLFMGGMAIAAAMQAWNLHRRVALAIMSAIGSEPRRLLAGMLASTAFVSLWISNTATAAMMLPIGLALITELERELGGRRLARFGAAIMLAIAYGSNVGGIGTKIGTAPNLQLAGFLAAHGQPVDFLRFMAIGTGFVLLFLPIVYLALWRLARADELGRSASGAIDVARRELGPMQRAEFLVLAAFGVAVVGWILSEPIHAVVAHRWPGVRTAHVEATTAVIAALALFFVRDRGRAVLTLAALRSIPWSSLILLGGSFAMAAAVQESGLTSWMAQGLSGLRGLSPFAAVLAASATTVAISAVCSNSATIAVMLPLLWSAVAREDTTTVLFAATIGASCDFALPAGTPPNAIVFGSGYVTIPRMLRTGLPLDLAAALVAAVWCSLAVRWIL